MNADTISACIGTLEPHPLNAEIYGDGPDTAFIDNVRKRGIIEPLIVTAKSVILAGNRRWQAAKKVGITEVPIRKIEIANEADEVRLILDSNRQRQKSMEQRLREFEHYLAIEKGCASSRRGRRMDLRTNSSTSPLGRARDMAAAQVGMSGSHAELGLKILHELNRCRDSDDAALSEKIRLVLNEDGIHAAHREVLDAGWMTKAAATRNAPSHSRACQPSQASRATTSPTPRTCG